MAVFKDTEKMFDEIARHYDLMNNFISFFTHKIVKRRALEHLKFFEGAKVLDLCTGTGDFAGIIKKKYQKTDIVGADNSSKMLEIARKKYQDIKFVKENAEMLPFENKSFDFVVMGFGLRNVLNKTAAAQEIARVIKTNGCFLHLDISKGGFAGKIFNFTVFLFAHFLKTKDAYEYLIKSKNEFMNPDEIVWFFENFGFDVIKSEKLMFGLISYQIFQKSDKPHI